MSHVNNNDQGSPQNSPASTEWDMLEYHYLWGSMIIRNRKLSMTVAKSLGSWSFVSPAAKEKKKKPVQG